MRLEERMKSAHMTLMNDPVAQQVNQSGKPRGLNILDSKSIYRMVFPSVAAVEWIDYHSHTEKRFFSEPFIDALIKDGWTSAGQSEFYTFEDDMFKKSTILLVKDPVYMITLRISYKDENKKEVGSWGARCYDGETEFSAINGTVGSFEGFTFSYCATQDKEDLNRTKKLLKDLYRSVVMPSNTSSSIGIISSRDGEYYVKKFSLVDKTPEFKHPDLHYGEGFEIFHKEFLERIKTQTKGLTLLHGEPGTGKTHYIRVLLKELCEMGKSVLYAPPNLSASLTEPEMIEFISDWILDNEKDCILLIEDAEPLLETRNGHDGRTTGVSNLLNITDGLLNDILGVVVMATFNTDLTKIDPALLRSQRLIARKKFKKMPKDRAELLSQELGIDLPNIKYPASLAEFYGEKMGMQVLIHDVEETKTIGFNR